jgi:hypothetical protein
MQVYEKKKANPLLWEVYNKSCYIPLTSKLIMRHFKTYKLVKCDFKFLISLNITPKSVYFCYLSHLYNFYTTLIK